MDFEQALGSLRKDLAACCGALTPDELPWSWVASNTCDILQQHRSGISRIVLLTELETRWYQDEINFAHQSEVQCTVEPFRRREGRPPPETIFNFCINTSFTLFGTNILMWRVSGAPGLENMTRARTSSRTMDMFVHQRYYPMLGSPEFSTFFSHNRYIYVTGLRLADRGADKNGKPQETLMPTTNIAFVLSITDSLEAGVTAQQRMMDEKFIRDVFSVEYAQSRFEHCNTPPIFEADQIWCRVECVGPTESAYKDSHIVASRKIQCVLEQDDELVAVTISLYGNDVGIARLYKPDDYIGLICPITDHTSKDTANGSLEIEYGVQTIAFILHALRDPAENLKSQVSIQPNEMGYLDYRKFAHRLLISQIIPGMINFTLIGRVLKVSENMPIKMDGKSVDRYTLHIEDGSGTCVVTLWGELGRAIANFEQGQLILLKNLDTGDEDDKVYISASRVIGSSVYNISTMSSILLSSGMRHITYLLEIPPSSNCYIKACLRRICPWGENLRDSRDKVGVTKLVHTVCKMPLSLGGKMGSTPRQLEGPTDSYILCCKCCNINCVSAGEVDSSYSVTLEIDDGTKSFIVHSVPSASREIIGISPEQLFSLTDKVAQQRALAKPLGCEIIASISSNDDGADSQRGMRIDSAYPANSLGINIPLSTIEEAKHDI